MGLSYIIHVGTYGGNNSAAGSAKTFTSLTGANGVTINPKTIQNVLRPVFEIDYNSALLNANYLHAPFLEKYYFISSVSINTAGRMVFECVVDPLKSYDLSNCPITVVRNGGIGAPTKINDNKLPISPNEKTVSQVPVTDYNTTDSKLDSTGIYILQCVGGQINGN